MTIDVTRTLPTAQNYMQTNMKYSLFATKYFFLIKFCLVLIISSSLSQVLSAQNEITISKKLTWEVKTSETSDGSKKYFFVENGVYTANPVIPVIAVKLEIPAGYQPSASFISHARWDKMPSEGWEIIGNADMKEAGDNLEIVPFSERGKKSYTLYIRGHKADPTHGLLLLNEYSITIQLKPEVRIPTLKSVTPWASNSVLSSGDWLRVGVRENGVYRVDFDYLRNNGLPVDGVPINNIKVYGHGGAMLPEANIALRPGDIPENAIFRSDINGNGIFEPGDFILFYGQSPHRWNFTPSQGYTHQVNLYSDVNFYFITPSGGAGKSIAMASALSHNVTSNSFDEVYFHENDLVNLIKSGREWYGEEFDRVLQHGFNVNMPGLITAEPVTMRTLAVGRSASFSSMNISVNGQNIQTINFSPIQLCSECPYTTEPMVDEITFNATQPNLNISYRYNRAPGESKAWLNYFELIARRQLAMYGTQQHFRDRRVINTGNIAQYNIANAPAQLRVWKITDAYEIIEYPLNISGGVASFNATASRPEEFIAFSEVMQPTEAVRIANQNLHGWGPTDYVMITHPDFRPAAEKLAEFHRNRGLRVNITTPQEIFNEFSSGKQDITAMRDLMKMLYDKADNENDRPKYLLMLGRASYDYKVRLKNNSNFVPTYQSKNSHVSTLSYCSDDFFGFMDDHEGEWNSEHYLDVAIGRLPVSTLNEAFAVVNKFIGYPAAENLGDWQNSIAFIADDEDGNTHMNDADRLAVLMDTTYTPYYIEKIYLDAYKQVSTGNGNRYPDAVTDINRIFNNGALVVNYSGHGGELGLAEESIVNVPQIRSWNSGHKLPLFITATCEFSRYDDPNRVSAGEWVILNPNGGAIGMFTTVRLVYAWPNYLLNRSFYLDNAFELYNGRRPTMGESFVKAKNTYPNWNSRNFTFLGDPALALNYPQLKVEITALNDAPASGSPEVVKAMSKITVKGKITDDRGAIVPTFNGTITPSVYDKVSTLTTLANDPDSRRQNFNLYDKLLFKGEASVKDGEFQYSFIVPIDISYRDGNGKIFHYAKSGGMDAHGDFQNFIISGESDGVAIDRQGPKVQVFMNDYNFKPGDITNENPLLLAKVFDESGINTTGNGIGRDLVAFLDGDRSRPFILNNFYSATLDSYQEGEIRFPMSGLSEGPHTITVRVWDVFNNSAEATTHFVVKNKTNITVSDLKNYPNPFRDQTTFYFTHNQHSSSYRVNIEIYDVAGAKVAELLEEAMAGSSNFTSMPWGGTNAGGQRLSPGIYIYRASITTAEGASNMQSGRMVLVP